MISESWEISNSSLAKKRRGFPRLPRSCFRTTNCTEIGIFGIGKKFWLWNGLTFFGFVNSYPSRYLDGMKHTSRIGPGSPLEVDSWAQFQTIYPPLIWLDPGWSLSSSTARDILVDRNNDDSCRMTACTGQVPQKGWYSSYRFAIELYRLYRSDLSPDLSRV